MEFVLFRNKQQQHIDRMLEGQSNLFYMDVDKDELWNLYLDSFPLGTNEIFRERREYDCSCCRSFIKRFGDVVVIKNLEVTTIWDFETGSATFQPVVDSLSRFVKDAAVKSVFLSGERSIGTDKNHEMLEDKSVITWNHFYYALPKRFVTTLKTEIPTIENDKRTAKEVFKRSLDELSAESVEIVLDLISQNSLYRGEEWKRNLTIFQELQGQYTLLEEKHQDLFCWEKSVSLGGSISKIRNHSMGTLLINLSAGMDVNEAVRKYEAIVAPSNYKRPKAIFTKKMLADAQKKVEELGLLDSLKRRFAVAEDISVNDVLFMDRGITTAVESENVFDDLAKTVTTRVKTFDRVEQVGIDKFIDDILPRAHFLEMYVENQHMKNLMSVIAPFNKGSNSLFKWDNGFSWAYNGNVTDSMKEQVKKAGGNVYGVLRFSIMWNEKNDNKDDLDAHCDEPGGNHIYFSNKFNRETGGVLDIDIQDPREEVAVENITWPQLDKMGEGKYRFLVENYAARGASSGFSAEIEFDGVIHSFFYDLPLRAKERIDVANVFYNRKDGFRIENCLPSSVSSATNWGVSANTFVPVSMCLLSPNHWTGEKGVGNKHYFFISPECINTDQPNGFFNEFLREAFTPHRKVFEALGSKMKVEKSDGPQLSGLGFCSTKRASIVCKVKGGISRVVKINF